MKKYDSFAYGSAKNAFDIQLQLSAILQYIELMQEQNSSAIFVKFSYQIHYNQNPIC